MYLVCPPTTLPPPITVPLVFLFFYFFFYLYSRKKSRSGRNDNSIHYRIIHHKDAWVVALLVVSMQCNFTTMKQICLWMLFQVLENCTCCLCIYKYIFFNIDMYSQGSAFEEGWVWGECPFLLVLDGVEMVPQWLKTAKTEKKHVFCIKTRQCSWCFCRSQAAFFLNLNQHLLGISPSRCDHRH